MASPDNDNNNNNLQFSENNKSKQNDHKLKSSQLLNKFSLLAP